LAQRLTAWERRTAFRLNQRSFVELSRVQPTKPTWTRARGVLILTSIALFVGTLGILWLGGELIRTFRVLPFLLGLFLIGLGFELLPRVPRQPTAYAKLSRDEAPVLHGIVDAVAERLGAPPVDVLTIDPDFNASCGRMGWRRRRVLTLGLPLWGSLSASARLALLGHEIGHLVNGDPGRAIITQPALTTFARLARIANPHVSTYRYNIRNELTGLDRVAERLVCVLLAPLFYVALFLQSVLAWVGSRDSQHAEYLADSIAAELAGSDGALELMTANLRADEVYTAVRRSARTSAEPAEWHAAAELACATDPAELRHREQHSIREDVLLWMSHPPSGLRLRMLRAWFGASVQPPSLTIDPERWRAADAELSTYYRRVARALQNS
jgi:Zn-dependent protease with chaperone function